MRCDFIDDGECLKELFGGSPHIGVCRHRCKHCTDNPDAVQARGYKGVPLTPQQKAERKLVKTRHKICDPCQLKPTCGLWQGLLQKSCRAGNILKKPGACCPKNYWLPQIKDK